MTVAEHASTPAVVRSASGTTGTTLTTAAFSPPAGSLLVVSVTVGDRNGFSTTPTGITLSTSVGGITFAPVVFKADPNHHFLYQGISVAYLAAAPGSTTVTATRPESDQADWVLAVRVVTGAASTQNGATINRANTPSGTGGSVSTAITPTQVGSLVYVNATTDDNATFAVVAGTTSLDNWADTANLTVLALGRAGATVSTSALTVGFTMSSSNTDHDTIVQAVEIVPATNVGAGTLAVTGSGSLSLSGGAAVSGQLARIGSGALSLAPTLIGGQGGTLTQSGSGSLSFGAVPRPAGTLAQTGSGALSFGQTAATASGTLARTGTGTAIFASNVGAGTLAVTGSGVLTLTGKLAVAGSLARTGSGALVFTGIPRPVGVLARTGSGHLVMTPGAVTTRLKRWDGSAWVPVVVRKWDGSAWVLAAARVWNGTAWV